MLTLDIWHPEEQNTGWISVVQYEIIGDMLIIVDDDRQDTWHRGEWPDDAPEETALTPWPVAADI